MHLTTRRKLLFALTLIFCVGGFALVLLSQGFSLNLETGIIEKRGGIFLRSFPGDARLFVNGDEREAWEGLISRGVFVSNLPSGPYSITLEKDGFVSWKKTLVVSAGMISSQRNIRLWPVSPHLSAIASSSLELRLTREGAVTRVTNGQWKLGDKPLKGTEVLFSKPTSRAFITKSGQNIFFTDLTDPQKSLNITDLFLSLKERQLGLLGTVPMSAVAPHPFSSEKLLITTQTSLYMLDTKKIKLERIVTVPHLQPVLATGSRDALLLDSHGNLIVADLIFRTTSPYTLRPLEARRLIATPDGTHVLILDRDGTLLHYDTQERILQELAHSVSDFTLSPEGKRVAFAEEGKPVTVFFLEDRYEENKKQEQGMRLVIPETAAARTIIWPVSLPEHLIVLDNNTNVIVHEINEMLPHNSALLASRVVTAESQEKNLYLAKADGGIFVINLETENSY